MAAEAGVPPGWEVTVDGFDGAPARQVRVQPLLPARQVPPGGGGAFLLEGFLSTAEASALLVSRHDIVAILGGFFHKYQRYRC